ncbi:N-acetylneuraminate synthase family protein [Candidatus Nitrosotenuis cloacae]|uniref:N-acetylneuraminate synthase family protein n=1 Tax=Candidatus Nitrosotenuis cloacae TaxID=1603555 RepID=UPI00227FF939|nr:N-acetylneuraminate synthase family protein [Candidatus Nitrosotenuis cloacae]
MIKPIKIGKKTLGNNHRCYVIAEIGSNFNRDIKLAKKLIKLAKESGADAAKFQSFIPEKIISKRGFEKKLAFQSKWKKSVWQVYDDAKLPLSWHYELNKYAKSIGIDFMSAPYYYEAVDLLVKLNVPAIKIGSGEITNLEFLRYVGKTNKTILLATGASTMNEVKDAVRTIRSSGNKKIILMQAVTQYPSPISDANLRVLDTFRREFQLNVGYSDHSPGILVILASVALGACVVEKHFTINKKMSGPDHPHSLDPMEFSQMVKKIREIQIAMGDGIKKIEKSEEETRIIQQRGIWTIKKISKGENFTRSNIDVLRPVLGVSAARYASMIGKTAKRNFEPYEPIKEKDV